MSNTPIHARPHCASPQLVTLGYTAVFFDADVALVKDPVPFLAQGRATVAVSFETRNCDSFVTSAAFRKEK